MREEREISLLRRRHDRYCLCSCLDPSFCSISSINPRDAQRDGSKRAVEYEAASQAMQVPLLAGYAVEVPPQCSHMKATTESLAPLHLKTTVRCPSHGKLSASKQRKPRSRSAERKAGDPWTISRSNASAPTAGNRWRLGLPSVSLVACRRAHHQRARQARFLPLRSQAIGRPTRRRQRQRKMIHSRLGFPLATYPAGGGLIHRCGPGDHGPGCAGVAVSCSSWRLLLDHSSAWR